MQRSRRTALAGIAAIVAVAAGVVTANASTPENTTATTTTTTTATTTATAPSGTSGLAATAGARRVLMLDFNMAGQSRNKGRLGVANEVVRSIVNRPNRPRAATLQEVCGSQAKRIRNRLKGRGYRVLFAPTPAGLRCKGGSKYGNAIVHRGPRAWSRTFALPHIRDGHRHQKRNMICVKLAKSKVLICNTHIDHKAVDIKRKQIPFVARKAKKYQAAGHAVIVAGDFNLRPHRNPMDHLYHRAYGGGAKGILKEATGCCGKRKTRATKDNGSKLDYIFVSKKRYRLKGVRIVNSPYSDHHRYWTTVRLR